MKKKKNVCACAHGKVWTSSEPHLVLTVAGLLKSMKLLLTACQVHFSFIPILHDGRKIKEKSVIKEAIGNCVTLLLMAAYYASPWS